MEEADGKRRSLAPQVAAGILAVVAVAALLSYVLPAAPSDAVRTGTPGGKTSAPVSVRRGVSCGPLEESQKALHRGDITALRRSISKAVSLAVASLKKDNLAFGSSERFALKLSSERLTGSLGASQKTRIASELTSALDGCPASQL
jgi:hypothetical protein